MGDVSPFIGAEALASGSLTRYELRRYYRAIMPNVYLDKRVEPSLHQRTVAAWLWTGREAAVAGLRRRLSMGRSGSTTTRRSNLSGATHARLRAWSLAPIPCSQKRCRSSTVSP